MLYKKKTLVYSCGGYFQGR